MPSSLNTKLRNRKYGFDSQSILVLSNVAITVLCLVIIGLAAHNIVYVQSPTTNSLSTLIQWNVTINDTELALNRTVAYLPEDLRLGSYWLMLSWGVGGFVLELILGSMLAWRHALVWKAEEGTPQEAPHLGHNPNDRNRTPQSQISLLLAVICLMWSIAATTFAFVQWQQSGKFDPSEDLYLTNGRYSSARGQGFFTPDAWTCQYEDYVVNTDIQNTINDYCIEGTSLRVVTLATTILGVALLAALGWRTMQRASAADCQGAGESDSPQRDRSTSSEGQRQRGRSRYRDSSRTRESLAPTIVANEKEDAGVIGVENGHDRTPVYLEERFSLDNQVHAERRDHQVDVEDVRQEKSGMLSEL